MLTTVSTTLFFLLITFLIYRKGFKKISVLFMIFSIVCFFILYNANNKLNDLSSFPIGKRRATIIQVAITMNRKNPNSELIKKIEQISSQSKTFTNADYDKVKELIPPIAVERVNAMYPNAASEDEVLNEYTKNSAN